MKKLLLIALLLTTGLTYGQNIPPSGTNFKILPTYSLAYYITDSTLWVYKGSVLGWTKLASGNNLKYKVDSIFSKVYSKSQADSRFEPLITPGIGSQYWAGNKSWQTLNTTAVVEGTNLYFTDTRARAAFSAGAGISISSGVITNTMPAQTVALTASPSSGITVSGTYPNYSITANKVEVIFTNNAAPVISSYDANYASTFGQSPRVMLITTDISGNEIIRSEQATLYRSEGKIQSISFDLPLAESGRIVLY